MKGRPLFRRIGHALVGQALHLACLGLLVLGCRQSVRRLFDLRLGRDSEDARALAGRAHLRAEAGDRAGAITDYRRLLAHHAFRNDAASWFNLAYLLQAGSRLEEAEPAFRRALALDERLDRAWYGLALVLAAQGRQDEAIDALRRNVELQPMSPHGREQLIRLHLLRHEHEEACKLLRQLRGFEPGVARRLEQETGLQA